MKLSKVVLLTLLLFMLSWNTVYPLTIKVGSAAPARSPWDKALRELGREWKRISNGTVNLKIYAGGIAGNESDTIRKMRFGTLGGAVLTNVGFTNLNEEVYVMNTPFLIGSDEELNYVLRKMKSFFNKGIEEKGFKVIIWSIAGWLNFFTEKPVYYPEDLKGQKISFSTGMPRMLNAWKKSGYHMVPNDLKDLMMGLQSGMVNAFFLPPLIAGSGQYFPLAPNMCTLKIAPLIGGMVVTSKVWEKIPEKYRQEMMEVTQRISDRLDKEIIKIEKETIEEMIKHGLKINDVPEDAIEKWKGAANKGMDELIGKAFSKETYDIVINYLKDFRKSKEN